MSNQKNISYVLPAQDLQAIDQQMQRILLSSIPIMQTLFDGEMHIGGDLNSHLIMRRNNFIELLLKWSRDLPKYLRDDIFHEIVKVAWNTVVYQPLLGEGLLRDNKGIAKEIFQIILPLCKISCELPLSNEDFQLFIHSLYDQSIVTNNRPIFNHNLLIGRLILHLFYENNAILKENKVIDEIELLVKYNKDFWNLFYVDIYYRHLCNYIRIEPPFLKFFIQNSNEFLKENQESVMSKIFPYIHNPINVIKEYSSLDELCNRIGSIAFKCSTTLECRWTLSTLLRLMPIFKSPENSKEFSIYTLNIIDNMDPSIVNNSSFLKFMYLKTLLIKYVDLRDIIDLKIFEKDFVFKKHVLSLHQTVHLQMEFAACLYIECYFSGISRVEELVFGNMVSNGLNLLETGLFSNHVVDAKTNFKTKLIVLNKKAISLWLLEYIEKLYRLYARRLIEGNHLNSLLFNASPKVYYIRNHFKRDVSASFLKCDAFEKKYSTSFFVKSLATFKFVGYHSNIEKIFSYIEQGLNADQYNIIINANNIGYSLYACYYYGSDSISEKVIALIDKFAKITFIDANCKSSKFYWVYYAGIKYLQLEIEQRFIKSLFGIIRNAPNIIHKLALRKDQVIDAYIPGEMIDLIKFYSKQKSLFALVAAEYIDNPELWNIMATTILNCKNGDDILRFEMASFFYSYAKCFARNNGNYDHKYCYNYIRCYSLMCLAKDKTPSIAFLRETGYYLNRENSKYFGYKKECTDPFFQLLSINLNFLPLYLKELFIKTIPTNMRWVKKMLIKYDLL